MNFEWDQWTAVACVYSLRHRTAACRGTQRDSQIRVGLYDLIQLGAGGRAVVSGGTRAYAG